MKKFHVRSARIFFNTVQTVDINYDSTPILHRRKSLRRLFVSRPGKVPGQGKCVAQNPSPFAVFIAGWILKTGKVTPGRLFNTTLLNIYPIIIHMDGKNEV
jgi:hypothetical protein